MCEKCFSDDIPHDVLNVGEDLAAADAGEQALSRRRFLAAAGVVSAMALVGCSRSAGPSQSLQQHVVTPGETISSVAADYGISIVELIGVNNLKGRQLRAGQRLFLPAHAQRVLPQPEPTPEPLVHQVKATSSSQVISRVQWGAPKPGNNWEPMGPVRFITLHHTDEHAGMHGLSDGQIVKNICLTHQRRGWADIGYHYLIGRDGRIYEGRRADRQGAHSRGVNNRNNLGISLIGNFDGQLPGRSQLDATQRFLVEQLKKYGLTRRALRGHREWSPTTCPGEALQSWLVGLRNGKALLPVA